MRIVLRSDIAGLGKRGDLVSVADGYGRNYLLPKGFAIRANPGILAQADAMRKARDVKDAKEKSAAETIAVKLVGMTFHTSAHAGKEGKLFGSVTSHDVVELVRAQSGIEIERRQIHLGDPIKTTGSHQVPVKLHSEVEIQLNIEVSGDSE